MSIYRKMLHILGRLQPATAVLMYHRIASTKVDPWKLSVSEKNFEEQLQFLKETGLVMPINDVLEQVTSNKIRPGIVLTFDDGYVDNYETAKPLLEKYDIPATFFISTKHIGIKKEFWWDELAYIFFEIELLPGELNLNINNAAFYFDLAEEEHLTNDLLNKHKLWDAYQKTCTLRSELYMRLWKILSPLHYAQQQRIIKELKNWAGVPELYRADHCSMSNSQLVELSNCKLFDIGAHTVSHPALANHSKADQHLEILESKQFLKKHTGSKIDFFAYPSGSYDERTIEILTEEGFNLAFTTEERVFQADDPYKIGRFQICDWNRSSFKNFLSKQVN